MTDSTPRITIIGTGYVGLVSGACFSEMGFFVTCVDKNEQRIHSLQENAVIPFYEPGLSGMVARNAEAGRLSFTTDLSTCVPQADAVFIAVGTPQGEDGSADLSYVFTASEEIAAQLGGYTVIVDKSTVPVGTGQKVAEKIQQKNPQVDFDVVSNPEFLREGSAVEDFMQPDRIVVGCPSVRSLAVMRALYRPLTERGFPLVETGVETAETIKYAANAFLATKISFINEVAHLCEAIGADVLQVAEGIGLDHRIGKAFLRPGPGYGGSCFPKDTQALSYVAQSVQRPLAIVDTVIASNEQTKQRMAQKIVAATSGGISGKTIGVLGLAFKPETDDMRESPALSILPELTKQGATIKAYDPQAMTNAKELLPELIYCGDAWQALKDVDVVVLMTEWQQFGKLPPAQMLTAMKGNTFVDLRNVFDPADMAQHGFSYTGIGRGGVQLAKTSRKVA